jgi:hypothetical protein
MRFRSFFYEVRPIFFLTLNSQLPPTTFHPFLESKKPFCSFYSCFPDILGILPTVCSIYMCEFCSFPTGGDRDAQHSDFAGFFSADAIDAAVLQANASRQQTQEDDEGEDDDTDGT